MGELDVPLSSCATTSPWSLRTWWIDDRNLVSIQMFLYCPLHAFAESRGGRISSRLLAMITVHWHLHRLPHWVSRGLYTFRLGQVTITPESSKKANRDVMNKLRTTYGAVELNGKRGARKVCSWADLWISASSRSTMSFLLMNARLLSGTSFPLSTLGPNFSI